MAIKNNVMIVRQRLLTKLVSLWNEGELVASELLAHNSDMRGDAEQNFISENAPKLGDVRVLNLNDGRRVMLCYTRKTSCSVFFLPILSACLQHVRTHVVEPDDKVVVPIMNSENEEHDERQRKQIQRLIKENLEGRAVVIVE